MLIRSRATGKPMFRGGAPIARPALRATPAIWEPNVLGTQLVFAGDTNDTARTPDDASAMIHLYDHTKRLEQTTVGNRGNVITFGGITGNKRVMVLNASGKHLVSGFPEMTNLWDSANQSVGEATYMIAAKPKPANFNAMGCWTGTVSDGLLPFVQLRQSTTDIRMDTTDGIQSLAAANTTVPSIGWHVYTMIKDGNLLSLRVDGVLAAQARLSRTTSYDFNLFTIGAMPEDESQTEFSYAPEAIAGVIACRAALRRADLADAENWLRGTCGLMEWPAPTPRTIPVVPTPTPTPELPPVINPVQMDPSQPGTIQAVGGVAKWKTLVRTQSLEAVEYRVYMPDDTTARGPWVQMGTGNTLPTIGIEITVDFVQTGDSLYVRKVNDWGVYARSGLVTVA